jgi:hypothetical protein
MKNLKNYGMYGDCILMPTAKAQWVVQIQIWLKE